MKLISICLHRSLKQIGRKLKSLSASPAATTSSGQAEAVSTPTTNTTSNKNVIWTEEMDKTALAAINDAIAKSTGGDNVYIVASRNLCAKNGLLVRPRELAKRHVKVLSPQAKLLKDAPVRNLTAGERARLRRAYGPWQSTAPRRTIIKIYRGRTFYQPQINLEGLPLNVVRSSCRPKRSSATL